MQMDRGVVQQSPNVVEVSQPAFLIEPGAVLDPANDDRREGDGIRCSYRYGCGRVDGGCLGRARSLASR
jgi:hypothetical protein